MIEMSSPKQPKWLVKNDRGYYYAGVGEGWAGNPGVAWVSNIKRATRLTEAEAERVQRNQGGTLVPVNSARR